MEKIVENLNELVSRLQKLLSLHRQLLESLRAEREALLAVDVKRIHEITLEKQGVLQQILAAEQGRAAVSRNVATLLNLPADSTSLGQIVLQSQSVSLKTSDQLRSVQQALVHLVARIQEQNHSNRGLVESSLEHVNQMKRNVLGEAMPKSSTYSSSGQRQNAPAQSRLISTEI
jgi:flagellar biosynthesis/type III secretory pathway chaperone